MPRPHTNGRNLSEEWDSSAGPLSGWARCAGGGPSTGAIRELPGLVLRNDVYLLGVAPLPEGYLSAERGISVMDEVVIQLQPVDGSAYLRR